MQEKKTQMKNTVEVMLLPDKADFRTIYIIRDKGIHYLKKRGKTDFPSL